MRRVALLCFTVLLCSGVSAYARGHAAARAYGSTDRWRLDFITDLRERAAVVRVLDDIDRGGPFVSEKDGSVFGNFERRLPAEPRRYYREYTVPTAGERTRGARRIIRGARGETYYTRDHYRTFVRIDRGD